MKKTTLICGLVAGGLALAGFTGRVAYEVRTNHIEVDNEQSAWRYLEGRPGTGAVMQRSGILVKTGNGTYLYMAEFTTK